MAKSEVELAQSSKVKILAERNEKINGLKRYDDTARYAGAILIVRGIVE